MKPQGKLRGYAVEEENLPVEVEPSWGRIQSVAAKALGRSPRGFLPDLYDQSQILGCGEMGCAWRTADKRFLVKVTFDATEGPIVSQIIHTKQLRMHPGIAYFRGIWRLPNQVFTDEWGYVDAYVILREMADMERKKKTRIEKVYRSLEEAAEGGKALIDAREDMIHCPPNKTQLCLSAAAAAEGEFTYHARALRGTDGEYVGQFLIDCMHHGIVLSDIHRDNVGYRDHNLKKYGVRSHRKLVATDIGNPWSRPADEGSYPRVRVARNPAQPRGAAEYWRARVPIL